MLISIVIPTYNRNKTILKTLQSFIDIDFDKHNFEIIVSDNNSTDNTAQLVKQFIEDNKNYNIHYHFEARQGVHYARNSAAKLTKGEFLYYTDDDMIADPQIFNALLKIFETEPKVGSATGVVYPMWEVEPPEWLVKMCSNGWLSLNYSNEEMLITDKDCGVYSCHQMMRREAFFNSGGFNPENTKGEWIGDGETGLNIKIEELGYKFGLTNKAVIYHIIPPARMTQEYLNKRLLNQGNCDSYTDYRKYKFSKLTLLAGIPSKFYKSWLNNLLSIRFKYKKLESWRMRLAKSYYWKARAKYDWRLAFDNNWRQLVLKTDWFND